jgi:hypothetical protein
VNQLVRKRDRQAGAPRAMITGCSPAAAVHLTLALCWPHVPFQNGEQAQLSDRLAILESSTCS